MPSLRFMNVLNFVMVPIHYSDIIMGTMMSQITSLTIVYSIIYSGADQRKHQSSTSLAFVQGIHRRPVNSLHKWPVTRKMFPFDDVIMWNPNLMAMSFHFYILHSHMWNNILHMSHTTFWGNLFSKHVWKQKTFWWVMRVLIEKLLVTWFTEIPSPDW